jgi:hypothetical protein
MSQLVLSSIVGSDTHEILQADEGVITLGRELDNNVVVDSSAVSRNHGFIASAGSQWIYCDLGSSNGSAINGVAVPPDSYRLLRNGDILAVADQLLRIDVNQFEEPDPGEIPPTSLLVFVSNRYETEFPLAVPEATFSVGGPESDLFFEAAADGGPCLQVSAIGSRLELIAGKSTVPIVVNGIAAAGVTDLNDRDEIALGNIRLIVNEPRIGAESRRGRAGLFPSSIARDKQEAIAHRGKAMDADWGADPSRKLSQAGRKFVFGQSAETDPTGTLAMKQKEFSAQVGFEVSPAQRFSGVYSAVQEEDSVSERFLAGIGIVALVVVIGGVFLVFSLFQ